MAANQTVAAFLDSVPDESRRADAKALAKLMQKLSGEKPKMWGSGIIGFGSYHYKYDSGREGDMPVVGFSPRKAATAIYGLDIAGPLRDKLGKHTTGAGCLYVKKLADVDQSVLEKMIQEAVTARLADH